jgi:hypothetical protein
VDRLPEYGIDGLFYPAVDGDFAALTAFTETLWSSFLSSTNHACVMSGVDWSIVDEAEFKYTRWYAA